MLKWLICLVMFSCRVGRGCYPLIMDKRCLRESNAPKVLLTEVVNSVVLSHLTDYLNVSAGGRLDKNKTPYTCIQVYMYRGFWMNLT